MEHDELRQAARHAVNAAHELERTVLSVREGDGESWVRFSEAMDALHARLAVLEELVYRRTAGK